MDMDKPTLHHDLDRALPHPEVPDALLTRALSEGRTAVRRRRTVLAGALTSGGLAAAGIAIAAVTIVGGQSGPSQDGPVGGTVAAGPPSTAQPGLSLAAMRQVVDACPGVLSLSADGGREITADGEPVAARAQVDGPGWLATEYVCGADVIRFLSPTTAPDTGVLGRYPDDADLQPLAGWGAEHADKLAR